MGEVATVLGDDGVVPLGHPLDEAVGIGRLGGGDHLLLGGLRVAEEEIFPDGAGAQPGLLEHHAVVPAQAPAGDIPDVRAVHGYAPGGHVVEAH